MKTFCITVYDWLYVYHRKDDESDVLVASVNVDEIISVIAIETQSINDGPQCFSVIHVHGNVRVLVSQTVEEVMSLVLNCVRPGKEQ